MRILFSHPRTNDPSVVEEIQCITSLSMEARKKNY